MHEAFQNIVASGLVDVVHGRPCGQIPQKVSELPDAIDHHAGIGHFCEGECDVRIAGIHELALRRPIGADLMGVEPVEPFLQVISASRSTP